MSGVIKGKEKTMAGSTAGRASLRWDDDRHLKFIELCEQEISKGNRPNTCLSKDGWKNMVSEFNKMTGRRYDKKQLKNHWDHMKAEWSLFKQLMKGETGLGWDDTEKTIIADDEWWERKIKENPKYKKFRNKNLSLIWFRYDALFSDIVATGDRAHAPSQDHMSPIGLEQEEEGINDIGANEGQAFGDCNIEGSDETDGAQNDDPIKFPEPSLKKQKSRDGSSSQVKKSKSKGGAASLKEDIRSLLEVMSNRSSATPSYPPHAASEPTIEQCIDILENIPNITLGSDLWNYACNLLCKKEMRQVFVRQPTDEARLSWLEFNLRCFMRNNPPPPL